MSDDRLSSEENISENEDFIEERYELARAKVRELAEVKSGGISDERFAGFFSFEFGWLNILMGLLDKLNAGGLSDNEYKNINRVLYSDVLPGHYGKSFCNPEYAVSVFGETTGKILSAVAYEMRCAIGSVFERQTERVLMRAELLIEIYGSIADAVNDCDMARIDETIKDIVYWYVSDYYETEQEYRIREMVSPEGSLATDIVLHSDLSDTSYLYKYGEYITENEIKIAEYLNRQPEEKIDRIADTFSEGYRIGFEVTRKDLSKKKTVNIRYPLGFERVIRKAVKNFEKMGLKPVIYRAESSFFRRQNVQKIGYFGANPNRQYDHDHSKDEALFLDGQLLTRKLECLEAAFEKYKEDANTHAGPAVMEIFGEEPFSPAENRYAYTLSKEQQELFVKGTSKAGKITNEYIKGEERSFTIMAFPSPAIGDKFEEIFDETLEINTLDYYLYRNFQQLIIDELDTAECVHIKGQGKNRTDINISLIDTKNPDKETKFENCVADVNIPVGEVFTSPVLKGTTGTLHVTEVYLNDLKFTDLELKVEDGFIKDYHLKNYDDEEKNKAYFKENVLFNHETLPMGEFAIGTNTRAYAMGRKFDIQGKLPILIAEKTGPHFAFGDTCYSHAEDVKVYNPDGKEIIARDNDVSILRKTDFDKAYFNCHTDVTLPYDEIGLIETIKKDGSRTAVIKDGRFALKGLEELNQYID